MAQQGKQMRVGACKSIRSRINSLRRLWSAGKDERMNELFLFCIFVDGTTNSATGTVDPARPFLPGPIPPPPQKPKTNLTRNRTLIGIGSLRAAQARSQQRTVSSGRPGLVVQQSRQQYVWCWRKISSLPLTVFFVFFVLILGRCRSNRTRGKHVCDWKLFPFFFWPRCHTINLRWLCWLLIGKYPVIQTLNIWNLGPYALADQKNHSEASLFSIDLKSSFSSHEAFNRSPRKGGETK
jgi:hypothetical protein